MGNTTAANRSRALGAALLVLLSLLAVARSAAGTRLDSLTIDEPWHIVAAIELGNARLGLGDAPGARRAYQGVLDAKQRVAEARTRAQIQAQIARIDSGIPAKQIASLRNPWLEQAGVFHARITRPSRAGRL